MKPRNNIKKISFSKQAKRKNKKSIAIKIFTLEYNSFTSFIS